MTRLKDLTKWNKGNRPNRVNNNPVRHTPKRTKSISDEVIDAAIADYTSGNFKFVKEVCAKNGISTGSMYRYAKIRGVAFVKKPQ